MGRLALAAAVLAWATAQAGACGLPMPPEQYAAGVIPAGTIDYYPVDDVEVWCSEAGIRAAVGKRITGCTIRVKKGAHPTPYIIVYPWATPFLGCTKHEIIFHEEAHVRADIDQRQNGGPGWTHE